MLLNLSSYLSLFNCFRLQRSNKFLNITPNYLTECCIKASHHNASFFIEHFTAEEIARLLKREDLSITDVAYQLDFNTTNYFTRYVKRVLGMTPSQYKAKFSVKK